MANENRNLTTDNAQVYRRLGEMIDRGEPGVLATVIATKLSTPRHAGAKMIVHGDGSVTGSVGGGSAEAHVVAIARDLMADPSCCRLELDLAGKLGICGGKMEVFLEPVLRSTQFVMIGAGHIGRAMVELGASLPFRFLVIDDRQEWLTGLSDRSEVTAMASGPEGLVDQLEVSTGASLLVASRNHELDGAYLRSVLAAEKRCNRNYAFLGVLGSRTKVGRLKQGLLADGFDPARIERLQMPVGLDLGAETPAEIALSILAEALAVIRGRTLLTDRTGNVVGVRFHRCRTEDSSVDGQSAKTADGDS